jgi:AbrB family looped-hinge helix DNA binding protein
MTQFYQSKIFANGSTTLPKPVRDALGIKAGDRVRYVISEKSVNVLRVPSDESSVKAQADDPDLREALDAAEKVMDENRTLMRKLK